MESNAGKAVCQDSVAASYLSGNTADSTRKFKWLSDLPAALGSSFQPGSGDLFPETEAEVNE